MNEVAPPTERDLTWQRIEAFKLAMEVMKEASLSIGAVVTEAKVAEKFLLGE